MTYTDRRIYAEPVSYERATHEYFHWRALLTINKLMVRLGCVILPQALLKHNGAGPEVAPDAPMARSAPQTIDEQMEKSNGDGMEKPGYQQNHAPEIH